MVLFEGPLWSAAVTVTVELPAVVRTFPRSRRSPDRSRARPEGRWCS